MSGSQPGSLPGSLPSGASGPAQSDGAAAARAVLAARFVALHARAEPFIIANAWDPGSARLLAAAGFEALATSSAAFAGVLGRPDGAITRDETLAQSRALVQAVDLPVSADLESGFGPRPEDVADTIRMAALVGLVGGSIEDATGNAGQPIFDFDEAVARVRAAVRAREALADPFVLTARAENFLHGRRDLEDTIRRLKAFEDEGADVLFAPGLPDLASIEKVCRAVSRPVNVLIGIAGLAFSVGELAGVGVRRISLGSSLYKAAMGVVMSAAEDMLGREGRFDYVADAPPTAKLNAAFAAGTPPTV